MQEVPPTPNPAKTRPTTKTGRAVRKRQKSVSLRRRGSVEASKLTGSSGLHSNSDTEENEVNHDTVSSTELVGDRGSSESTEESTSRKN